jgi:hypothetical protein
VRAFAADVRNITAGDEEDSMIGYDHGFWLVLVLLVLTAGLAGALWHATRGGTPTAVRSRRPR